MSYHQFGIDPVYFQGAAGGLPAAQRAIAIGLALHAERIAADTPQFAHELLAVAEFSANLAASHGDPADDALTGLVLALRSVLLDASDPVRALGYRTDAMAALNAAAKTGDVDALRTVALAYSRLADAGDDEAATRLNFVVGALPPEEAVQLREVMRQDATERRATLVQGG